MTASLRPPRLLSLSALTALLALLLPACKGGESRTGGDAPLRAADLLPLAVDNVWTYDAYDQDGHGPTLAGLRVTEAAGNRFVLESLLSEDTARIYELRDEGIFLPEHDAWLLRDPIEVGRTWRARGLREATVRALDVRASVPRGDFEGCVQVDEDGGELNIHVETIYCPGVGAVSTRSSMRQDSTGLTMSQRAVLREYAIATPDEAGE